MKSASFYRFSNVFILKYEWGLAAYVGTEWHVFEENLLPRSLAVRNSVDAKGFHTTIFPLLRNRIGPFLDWLNTASQSVVQLTGTEVTDSSAIEFRRIVSSFCDVLPTLIQIEDHLSFDNRRVPDRGLVVLSGASMLVFRNSNDAIDLILRAQCTSRVAAFIRDARKALGKQESPLPVFATREKLSEYGEWCCSQSHCFEDAASIGFIEGSKVALSGECFSLTEKAPRVNPLIGPIRFSSTRARGGLFSAHAWEAHKTLNAAQVEVQVKVEAGALKTEPVEAERVARWEAWERHCIRAPATQDLTVVSVGELKPAVLAFLREGLYCDSQYKTPGFPYRCVNLGSSLTCTDVVDCVSGEVVAMPADLVWLTNLNGIVQSTSNGSATYSDYGSAALRGLLELIERHVFLKIWHSCYPVTRYRIESLPRENGKLAAEFPTNLEVSVVVAKFMAGEFSVFCSYVSARAISPTEGPSCVLGGGASFSVIESISRAIEECLRGIDYYETVIEYLSNGHLIPKCLTTPLDHVSWHWLPGRRARSRKLFDHRLSAFPRRCEWPSYHAEEAFCGLAHAITAIFGGNVWAKQLAPVGCENTMPVVRVISSELTPLYFGPHLVRNPKKHRLSLWNLSPHPFP